MKSFGPSAYRDNTTGEIKCACVHSGIWCFLWDGKNMCRDQAPPREIPDTKNTPDWCKYREGIMEDVREAEDFHRLGLDKMSRHDLMKRAKELPREYRTKPLNRMSKYQLQRIIRKVWRAEMASAESI